MRATDREESVDVSAQPPFRVPEALAALEEVRGHPVIAFLAPIDDDTVPVLYQALLTTGPVEHLDLLLSTMGGTVTTARRIAMLLREHTGRLTILVPHRARSAGTLLCLGADDLVLGPMAELSPVDPNVSAAGPPPSDTSDRLSAEDIRAFSAMANDWFGVTRDEDQVHVLALVAQRVFPGSLAALYRFDRLSRRTAGELLRYQLPDADETSRQRIVDQLVGGYGAHDHVITRADAVALGLEVVGDNGPVETLAWDVLATLQAQMVTRPSEPGREGVTGFVIGSRFRARRMLRWEVNPRLTPGADPNGPEPPARPRVDWAIDASAPAHPSVPAASAAASAAPAASNGRPRRADGGAAVPVQGA